MDNKELDIQINKYIESQWDNIVKDIASLIEIPSVQDESTIDQEFPTGKMPAKALNKALEIARKMGFETTNHKNIIGFADLKGKSNTQIGFIGHLDVVPDGPGWHFNPYHLTIEDEYMIGRGIIDDKGPVVLLLHAINFWLKNAYTFPYSIRYIFGTNEESGSTDVEEYKKEYNEPRIVITPDANFPICYGEKGLCRFVVKSKKIKDGQFLDIHGGVANNAVAGLATSIVRKKPNQWINKQGSRLAHAITIDEVTKNVLNISAHGRSAHAAVPYGGIDSIAVLSQFLLEKNIGNEDEQDFLKFLTKVAGKPNGQGLNIDCRGVHLSRLTIVPSLLKYQDNHFVQIFDVRYPSKTNPQIIKDEIKKHLPNGSSIKLLSNIEPMLLNPNSKFINALSKAFKEATNIHPEIFTMGGATYARDFGHATSFGPIMDWVPNPAWVGSLHGPDEGLKISVAKDTFKIYVHAIKNLMQLDLDADDFFDDFHLIKGE